jgi:lipoprotein-anchoring transpeptidase ErfK/SrfK
MVPSAARVLIGALFAAAAALVALPAAQAGLAADREAADQRPEQPSADAPRFAATTTVTRAPGRTLPAERPAESRGYRIVRVRAGRTIALRAKPGGPKVEKLGARTEFGSKRVLGVVKVHGRWLGVTVPELPNGKVGWIDGRSDAIARDRTKVSLRADLSRRTLELRVGRKVVDRMRVAVGRSGSSTPTGRFAVTDKMSGDRYGPYYGCCILAISGTQPNLPAGWSGGNRLAVHGTNVPGTVGKAASAGCLRGGDEDLRVLMRRVPLGAPIFIKR